MWGFLKWCRIEAGCFTLFGPKHCWKIVEIRILVYFDGFLAKTWVKYYPSSILIPCLESSHQEESFGPSMWFFVFYFDFLHTIVFLIFYLLCVNWKSSFYWRKMAFFVIHIPLHVISSRNLEKVEFGEKWKALLGTGGIRLYPGMFNWSYEMGSGGIKLAYQLRIRPTSYIRSFWHAPHHTTRYSSMALKGPESLKMAHFSNIFRWGWSFKI